MNAQPLQTQHNPLFPDLQPRHRTLYRLAADGRTLEFFFARCTACDALTFPANAPGCMHCGDSLRDAARVARPGIGTLLEYVTVHVPLAPGMPAPMIAGDIRLAEGMVEEAVIGVADEAMLRPGMAMLAVADVDEQGRTFSCAFVPASGEDAR